MEVLSALKPLINNKQMYEALMDYLDYRLQREQTLLENANDLVSIHRSQGRIAAYRVLKGIKQEVSSYEQNR